MEALGVASKDNVHVLLVDPRAALSGVRPAPSMRRKAAELAQAIASYLNQDGRLVCLPKKKAQPAGRESGF